MHDSVSYMSSCIHIWSYMYIYIHIRAIMIVYFPKGRYTASIIIFPKKSSSPRPPRHRGNECHSLGARRGSSAEMDSPVFRSQQTECNATDSLDGALQMKETSLLFLKLHQHPLKLLTVYIQLIYVVLVVLLYCKISYWFILYHITSSSYHFMLYYWHCILKVGTVMTLRLKPEKMPMSPVDFLNSDTIHRSCMSHCPGSWQKSQHQSHLFVVPQEFPWLFFWC